MYYNTGYNGNYSSAYSAALKSDYVFRMNEMSAATPNQKKYLSFLMATADKNNIDIGEALMHLPVRTREDYANAIFRLRQVLLGAGVEFNDTAKANGDSHYKRRMELYNHYREEAKSPDWIPIGERQPDCKYIKLLQENGWILTAEYDLQRKKVILSSPPRHRLVAWKPV